MLSYKETDADIEGKDGRPKEKAAKHIQEIGLHPFFEFVIHHFSFLCDERVCAGGLDGTGIRADSGSILQEDFFEGPVLVGFKNGGGGDFIGDAVLGFTDQEDQIMAVPFDEFEGVFGFGGGIKLGGLEFLFSLFFRPRKRRPMTSRLENLFVIFRLSTLTISVTILRTLTPPP